MRLVDKKYMERIPFDDLPTEVALLRREIAELKAIIQEKLTTPKGYQPDVTMSAEEVAKYIGCTKQNVHKKKDAGQLPFHKVGRTVYFKKSEVDAASKVNQHKRKFFK